MDPHGVGWNVTTMRRRLPFIDMDLDAAELLATVEQHGGRIADTSYQSNALERAPLKLPADTSEVDRLPVLVASMLRWARGVLTELVARERAPEHRALTLRCEQAEAEVVRLRTQRQWTTGRVSRLQTCQHLDRKC